MNNNELPYTYYNTKQRMYLLTRKLYKYIREHGKDVRLSKLPTHTVGRQKIQTMGYYHFESNKIELDYRFEIIPTFIHECLHHYHPDWNEERVCSEERKVMAMLSRKQARNILKALSKAL